MPGFSIYGTTEAVPFQGQNGMCSEIRFELIKRKTIPQRLKPGFICGIYGTTEVVPFQNTNGIVFET